MMRIHYVVLIVIRSAGKNEIQKENGLIWRDQIMSYQITKVWLDARVEAWKPYQYPPRKKISKFQMSNDIHLEWKSKYALYS